MPDRQPQLALSFATICQNSVHAGSGDRRYCDFAVALLREFAGDPPRSMTDVDARYEALPDDEAATILRALAGEMRSRPGIRGWLDAMPHRLGWASRRCLDAIILIVAPICSMVLNIDALAMARRLCADPALHRRGRGNDKI